jgi:hypothetical protein
MNEYVVQAESAWGGWVDLGHFDYDEHGLTKAVQHRDLERETAPEGTFRIVSRVDRVETVRRDPGSGRRWPDAGW